ncbi:hypothetical protein FHT32_006509 [Variovorax sp. SG517]|uniref:hypothetical protein n=1 Tax=Variovorax sp. SG517 TaxID=2587117 RepID=UPI00159E6BD6|nr:hypothetical protein [Variovorax sp. SG517]NVM92816.1 hypothetical protein [Variovorax sp. SG517]
MPTLRHIAITVVENTQGAYRWRLIELDEAGWRVLREQPRPVRSYKAAMAAGLLQLQGMIDDLDVGPVEEEVEATPAAKKGPSFGFGFGLPALD